MAERKAARLLAGGAGLLLVFSACSGATASPKVGSVVTNTTTTIAGVIASTTVAPAPALATGAPTTVAAAPAGPPQPTTTLDGAALLQQAVAATGAGYHFNETATVDGVVALTIDGDRLPSGARLAVSSPTAGLVYYVINPDGTWLMPDGGVWEVDNSPAPEQDPIAALGTPSSVNVASSDGTTVHLAVTVPIASLGIPGEGEAALQVSVASGALSSITYSTTTADGKAASTTTLIAPVADASPVVAPI